jgi:hypothetical protein
MTPSFFSFWANYWRHLTASQMTTRQDGGEAKSDYKSIIELWVYFCQALVKRLGLGDQLWA